MEELKKNLYLIGQTIKIYRRNLNLSQEELAFKANLDRTYISKLEQGQMNATIKSLTKIANALEINIFILIKEAENPKDLNMCKQKNIP